jgi:preprotein translocase subunit SecE
MSRFINYIKDTKAELKHVSWPTGRQAVTATVLVVLISLVVALFTGALDYVFTQVLNWIIG